MGNLSIIVAMSSERAIGANNNLLWHLPSDLKRFKELTTGHSILMGRKTFESLPKGALPNRRNIVISRSISKLNGAEVYSDIKEALAQTKNEDEVFIIGGGQIYESLLPYSKRIYLSIVEGTYPEATVFFPEFNWNKWEIEKKEEIKADERNPLAHTFYILKRKALK